MFSNAISLWWLFIFLLFNYWYFCVFKIVFRFEILIEKDKASREEDDSTTAKWIILSDLWVDNRCMSLFFKGYDLKAKLKLILMLILVKVKDSRLIEWYKYYVIFSICTSKILLYRWLWEITGYSFDDIKEMPTRTHRMMVFIKHILCCLLSWENVIWSSYYIRCLIM